MLSRLRKEFKRVLCSEHSEKQVESHASVVSQENGNTFAIAMSEEGTVLVSFGQLSNSYRKEVTKGYGKVTAEIIQVTSCTLKGFQPLRFLLIRLS